MDKSKKLTFWLIAHFLLNFFLQNPIFDYHCGAVTLAIKGMKILLSFAKILMQTILVNKFSVFFLHTSLILMLMKEYVSVLENLNFVCKLNKLRQPHIFQLFTYTLPIQISFEPNQMFLVLGSWCSW